MSPESPLSKIASRVVLEITERCSLDGVAGLAAKLAAMRGLGFRLAVDDLGAGYAGLSSFATLEPEFVKLDMSLIRGVDASPKKRSVVSAMIRLCTQELGMQVISEGIETSAERDALAAEGEIFCRVICLRVPRLASWPLDGSSVRTFWPSFGRGSMSNTTV